MANNPPTPFQRRSERFDDDGFEPVPSPGGKPSDLVYDSTRGFPVPRGKRPEPYEGHEPVTRPDGRYPVAELPFELLDLGE